MATFGSTMHHRCGQQQLRENICGIFFFSVLYPKVKYISELDLQHLFFLERMLDYFTVEQNNNVGLPMSLFCHDVNIPIYLPHFQMHGTKEQTYQNRMDPVIQPDELTPVSPNQSLLNPLYLFFALFFNLVSKYMFSMFEQMQNQMNEENEIYILFI